MRSDGMPTTAPARQAAAPPAGIASQNGSPSRVATMAVA
jgi:hypothetical protein